MRIGNSLNWRECEVSISDKNSESEHRAGLRASAVGSPPPCQGPRRHGAAAEARKREVLSDARSIYVIKVQIVLTHGETTSRRGRRPVRPWPQPPQSIKENA